MQTPSPLTESSRPTGLDVAFSPLWVYWIARQRTAQYDRSILRGEGAIVSDALEAVRDQGVIALDAWPPDYDSYYTIERSGRLPAAVEQAERHKAIGDTRRLEDPDQVLEYLAGGYSVWIGVPWRSGSTTRREPDGTYSFSWGSSSIGGHAVELLGYDLDADRIWIGNSWMGDGRAAGWGDPERGVAWTRWSSLSRDLSAAALSRGISEAVVFAEVQGNWSPKTPDPPAPEPKPGISLAGFEGTYVGRRTKDGMRGRLVISGPLSISFEPLR